MNKIKILTEFLANQIAAGEVVQTPESVVKELVENAIDAGATNIQVILKKSGKTLIHVIDNGFGMSKEDLLVAPLRHATSKLFTTEQLDEIRTFGFRGEALAAISSVSLLEIRTRTKDSEHGWRLVAEPQKEFIIEPVNINPGTQIFVQNLFYNTPARRKFLKSDLTELRRIQDTLYKLALSNSNIEFSFYNDEKLIFNIKPSNLEYRINSLFGDDYSNNRLLRVDKQFDGVFIHGYVGQPHLARQTAATQYFFLNKRAIISKSLSYAVFSAFEHLIAKNLKPFFILNIEIDYKKVDVNVHPQKTEVRFEDEKYIFSCIKEAVSEALKLENLVTPVATTISISTEDNSKLLVDSSTGEIIEQESSSFNREVMRGEFYPVSSNRTVSPDYYQTKNQNQNYKNNYKAPLPQIPQKTFDYLFGQFDDTTQNIKNNLTQDTETTDINKIKNSLVYNNIWQLHNKYILLETTNGMLVIDQHNADERWIYENIVKKMHLYQTSKQALLFPIEINLSHTMLLAVMEIEKELQRIGFEFTYKDENKIIVTAQPDDLNIISSEHTFLEIIEEYLHCEELKHSSKQEKIAASIACKSAIKAGHRLETPEMMLIIQRLFECEMPYVCPHGRPIITEYSLAEMDKKLGR